MSLPQNWPSYVGIGLSLASLAVSVIALRRSLRVKRLDLRLELRKAVADNQQQARSLETLIVKAQQSREATAAARGMARTGNMEAWKRQTADDMGAVRKLLQATGAPLNHASLSEKQLEDELVTAHSRKREIEGYLAKYRAALENDDKDREFLRAAAYDRARPK